jgi:hypothetical protein
VPPDPAGTASAPAGASSSSPSAGNVPQAPHSGPSIFKAVNDVSATSDQGQKAPTAAAAAAPSSSTQANAGTSSRPPSNASASTTAEAHGHMCDMADSFRTYLKDVYSVFALLVSWWPGVCVKHSCQCSCHGLCSHKPSAGWCLIPGPNNVAVWGLI